MKTEVIFLDILSKYFLKHKKSVTVLFLTAALIFGLMIPLVRINYNMADYLPEDAQSTKALQIMADEFGGSVPNIRIMVPVTSIPEALAFKKQLEAIDGISDVLWLDSAADLKQPLQMLEPDTVGTYYKDGMALFDATVSPGAEAETVEALYRLAGSDGALSGEAVTIASAQEMAQSETLRAMLILVPLILLILLLFTSSWIEPLFFLLAIGVAVLINLGTNLFLGEISFITQAVSPILQLAVSLDYAIFLLHRFSECRQEAEDPQPAMQMAMKKAFSAIAASAATTLFGFVALSFMNFRIGPDLSLNLVKGILLSFLSVMIFLPAVTLCFYRWIDKTRHRQLLPVWKGIGKFVLRLRIPVLILIALLIVPGYLAQTRASFTYGMGDNSPGSRLMRDDEAINTVFGESTAIVLLVPKGHVAAEKALDQTLKGLDHVTGVISYTAMADAAIPSDYLDASVTSQFYSDHYTRMIVNTDTQEEGAVAFETVEQVMGAARSLYPEGVYSCGESVNLYDMKTTVTADNSRVNLIALISIALVLLLTFRSLTFPLLLLLTIETAIWINLAVPYFQDSTLNYLGFLVINTVQLGATVDYAILLSDRYKENRKSLPAREALCKTLANNYLSILVSGSILSFAGFCLYLTSSNQIISQLGLLLGRGTLLSMLMVLFFLPALLLLFDPLLRITTIHSNFCSAHSGNKKRS